MILGPCLVVLTVANGWHWRLHHRFGSAFAVGFGSAALIAMTFAEVTR
jgi:hypothetical protein